MRTLEQVAEQEARKVGMHALVTRDELVGEGQPRHETALLEPEDARKGPAEEDTLDGGKGDEALREGAALVGDPVACPIGLLLDARDGLDGIEQVLALSGILDVGVDEERVCLRVDVLPMDDARKTSAMCSTATNTRSTIPPEKRSRDAAGL